MQAILIAETKKTPKVVLDPVSNHYEVSGKCLPENAIDFFNPVLSWLEHLVASPNDEFVFNFKLDYFNTASSKLILDILIKLEKIQENNVTVLVNWAYSEEDDDMKEAGEDYSDLVDIPFEINAYSN